MENCIYRGRTLCTFDLKDENGFYYEELVLEWKEAAVEGRLTCPECGARVYLGAGPVKEPYFAHYDLEDCEYSRGKESEELKKGKRLLYQLLRRSLPCYDIQARYRLENGMFSTLFCTDGSEALAVEYRLVNNSLQKFRIREEYYQNRNIKVLSVLGKHQEKDTKQLDWYQNLLQNRTGCLIFLDAEKETITLKKCFGYRMGKERRFQYCIRTYPVRELTITLQGQITCDFDRECTVVEQAIQEEKQQFQREQDWKKQLREAKERQDIKEAERLTAYRRQQEQETQERILALGLNPELYKKCVKLMEEGNAGLVAKKYMDAILEISNNRRK